MRGAAPPTPTMDTWVPDTCRELKQVLDAGDLGYPVWGLILSEVARPAGTGCQHGDMTPGCQQGCRCSDPGRGLGFPGWSHRRAERQFESFLISPSRLRSGGGQNLTKLTWSFEGAHLCRASKRRQRSLKESQTHVFLIFSQRFRLGESTQFICC